MQQGSFTYAKCQCQAGFKPGIILDPFFGRGTAGKVAFDMGRDYIGIELNPEYVKLAKKFIGTQQRLDQYLPEETDQSEEEILAEVEEIFDQELARQKLIMKKDKSKLFAFLSD